MAKRVRVKGHGMRCMSHGKFVRNSACGLKKKRSKRGRRK